MTTREWLEDEYPEALVMEERYDDCIIAAGTNFSGAQFVVYDFNKVICVLMEQDGMTWEEAWEWYEFNMLGSYVGMSTPAYVEPKPADN
jgi:hypothetical protein